MSMTSGSPNSSGNVTDGEERSLPPFPVEASMEDGVLHILVPKAEQAKPKRIQVNPGGQIEAIAGSSRPS